MKNTLASIVSNKDVGARNRAISLITQCMKQHMSAEEVAHLATKVQAAMHGRHFDAGSAKEGEVNSTVSRGISMKLLRDNPERLFLGKLRRGSMPLLSLSSLVA